MRALSARGRVAGGSGRAAGRGNARQGAAGRDNALQGTTGVRPVRAGWASWVLVHSAWFSTWFFDSEFFLSHQMNTVHCKINFGKFFLKI